MADDKTPTTKTPATWVKPELEQISAAQGALSGTLIPSAEGLDSGPSGPT